MTPGVTRHRCRNAIRSILFATLIAGMTAAAPCASAHEAAPDAHLEASVVKLTTSSRWPDPWRPWTGGRSRSSTASGVVIDGGRIITCAHAVTLATEVLVESDRLRRRVPAHVEFIAQGMDLAVLRVDAPSFANLHTPVQLEHHLPQTGAQVRVLGYPRGGSAMSKTEGVISRVEFEKFYLNARGFRIQVDAPVNPGNSGGPAFVGDDFVGIVFSRIEEAENIGYVIPSREILRFLEDVEDGQYDGKSSSTS